MVEKEILDFCIKRGFLLDKEILELLSETKDMESVKLIIENLKDHAQHRIITKNIFDANRDKINQFFLTLPKENQKSLEKLKIKLGMSIEISKEIYSTDPEKKESFSEKGNVNVEPLSMFPNKKIEVSDFVGYFRERFEFLKNILQEHSSLTNLVSINKVSGNMQGISLIGMVSDKRRTKNGNILFEIEDFTGKIKVLVNNFKKEIYDKAEEICLDSVVGFTGSGNNQIFFANDIVFPDSFLQSRKRSPVEEYALFIGDLHFGSKLFLKKNFLDFIDYLNGKVPNTPEVQKIKYLFLVGDIITGVGNYPGQENDLEIQNLEEQFIGIAELLGKIRKDIQIIISPGNHDGVRLLEPQPVLDQKFAWALYDLDNVTITENPSTVNIASRPGFSGLNVLSYHGFSFFYYANNIPSLIKQDAGNKPHKIMNYLLKNRHLAPTHASTQYVPLEKDYLLIRKIPDIFVSGHTHKSSVSYYNNILLISVSCWESMTSYQEKRGNKPDFCKVPMINLKTGSVKILDFEGAEDGE